jgi:hypothetical protein
MSDSLVSIYERVVTVNEKVWIKMLHTSYDVQK